MTNYQELLVNALAVHDNARQSVRGPTSAKRIADAVAGFAAPLKDLSRLVADEQAGKTSDPDDTQLLGILRNIQSQRDLLQSAVERAQADDDAAVKGVVVQQSAARAVADKQKDIDTAFLAKVDEILDLLREDLAQAGV